MVFPFLPLTATQRICFLHLCCWVFLIWLTFTHCCVNKTILYNTSVQLQAETKQSPNQEEHRSVIPNTAMTRHERLAVSHWKEENSHFLTPFPRACLYELGAASEIPAVEYCSEGICTSLGTTMQGTYTKIYRGAAPSQDFTGYTPAQAGHKRECVGESYKFIYKSNCLFFLFSNT